jgi:putative aldouronate transport system permease protein
MQTSKTFPLSDGLGYNRYRFAKDVNQVLMHLVAALISLSALIPFVISISASLSSEKSLAKFGYSLFPRELSTAAYQLIWKAPEELIRSYGVTLFVTVVGTLLSLLVMTPFAYALSREDFRLRSFFSLYMFVTMVFSGGLVPWYLLIKQYLHLDNTIWVMIIPFLVNGFTVIILRSNFSSLPQEIVDAAKIDGAGEWRILGQIAVPMTAPTIAALGIFIALGFWNTYYPALLFIDERILYPLQYTLYILQTNLEMFQKNPNITGISIPVVSLRYAMVVLISFPVVFFVLFFQKYFVKGVYLGGMKE